MPRRVSGLPTPLAPRVTGASLEKRFRRLGPWTGRIPGGVVIGGLGTPIALQFLRERSPLNLGLLYAFATFSRDTPVVWQLIRVRNLHRVGKGAHSLWMHRTR